MTSFVDTSFWFSLQERRDRHHAAAVALVQQGLGNLVTTNHVLGETWTLLRRRGGHRAATGFIDRFWRLPNVQVLHVSELDEQAAWKWLRHHDEGEYSFVDATSFVVMRRHSWTQALAFDSDFTAAGFVELRP